jgi:hypothetical protein
MSKSINIVRQKKRGRPRTGITPAISLRLPSEAQQAVEAWAAEQHDKPTLSEAIRRLVEAGLAAKRKR